MFGIRNALTLHRELQNFMKITTTTTTTTTTKQPKKQTQKSLPDLGIEHGISCTAV